jgi:hypothetical protein
MRPVLLACLAVALAGDAWAHRLDEYLQTTRIAVATNRIDLSIELTPGVAVAEQLLAVIDTNRDGQFSESERTAYLRGVLKDIRVALDKKVLALKLADTSFPTLSEIRSGVGVVRIKATIPIGPLSVGNHTVTLTNAHLPAISVYLVNALVPKDPAIQIMRQTRDELQKDYCLEFAVISALP